ncbi:MAG: hypothetical protein ACR2II_06260 [Chthoniobacterales bacterium]
MGKWWAKLDKEWGAQAHRIFYMATPPSMFGETPSYRGLVSHNLSIVLAVITAAVAALDYE